MSENLKELAYETIKQKIIYCEYRPNTFLSESLLMKEIDASWTPIREALNKLEQEGLVTIIPKKGIMVTALSLSEVNMAFDTRILIEPYILERYMEYLDRVELARMEEVFRKMLEGAADPDEFGRMDDAFHRMLTSVCTNKYLNMSLAHVFDQSMRIRLLAGVHIWERHKEAAREHVEIIEAVKSGEKERAKAGLLSHLNASKTAAVRSLMDETMPIC